MDYQESLHFLDDLTVLFELYATERSECCSSTDQISAYDAVTEYIPQLGHKRRWLQLSNSDIATLEMTTSGVILLT